MKVLVGGQRGFEIWNVELVRFGVLAIVGKLFNVGRSLIQLL